MSDAYDEVPQWILDSYDSDEHFFDIANALLDLYVSYKGRYVITTTAQSFVPKSGKNDLRLDNRAICAHLNHKFAVSVYAGKMCSKFLCFDIDDGSQKTVRSIIDVLEVVGFQRDKIYVSTSGRKGFHVEIFFDKLMYTSVLHAFYEHVCREAHLDKHKVEFRPTFTHAIKLPLGIHPATGDICWFINQETFEPIKDPRYILNIQKFNCEDSYKCIRFWIGDDAFFGNAGNYSIKSGKKIAAGHIELVGGGLYGYPNLTAQHMTHKTIIDIAIHERYKGLREEDIVERLNEWLDDQDEQYLSDPIPRIRKDIVDAAKWVYSESFHVAKKFKMIFTADEMKLLFEKRPRVQRKFLFAVLCYQKKYGMLRLGAEKIAEEMGCSRLAVIKAADALANEGIVEVVRQSAVKLGEAYKPMPNMYRVIGKAKNPDKVWLIADEVELDDGLLSDMWIDLIRTALKEDDLKRYFSKKELAEIQKGEDNDG